jgi:TolB protein
MRLALALAVLTAFASSAGAGASGPAGSGLIAFVTTNVLATRGVFSVRPDGTGRTRLPSGPVPMLPAVSADGSLIAYTVDDTLWVGRSDGSGEHSLGPVGSSPSFSPDGTQLVVDSPNGGLAVVDTSTGATRAVTTDQVIGAPQWSHDGTWIAYVEEPPAQGSRTPPYVIRLVRPDGSDGHVVVGNVDAGVGFAWSPDSTRIALRQNASPHRLELVDVSGKATTYPTQIVTGTPAWSPDGTRIAYGDTPIGPCGKQCAAYLTVLDVATRRMAHLASAGSQPAWSRDGRQLAYLYEGRAVRVIDAAGGRPDQIVNRVDFDAPAVAWTADGRIIYGAPEKDVQAIAVVPASGGTASMLLPGTAGARGAPAWSRDGRRLAFTRGSSVVVADADGSHAHAIAGTDPGVDSADPSWSPDGRRLAFVREDGVYVVDAGGGVARRIVTTNYPFSPAWSPDGRLIAFGYGVEYGNSKLGFVSPDGSHRREIRNGLTQDERIDWSPDGRLLAIVRTFWPCEGCEDRPVLFAMTTAGRPAAKYGHDLDQPSWSPDGSELAVDGPDGTIDVIAADGTKRSLGVTGSFPAWQP